MISTMIFPGRYLQGKDAMQKLGEELSRYGQKGLAVCTSFVYSKMLEDIESCMKDEVHVVIEKFGGECSDEEIERLVNLVEKAECHFVVGIGGGGRLLESPFWTESWGSPPLDRARRP